MEQLRVLFFSHLSINFDIDIFYYLHRFFDELHNYSSLSYRFVYIHFIRVLIVNIFHQSIFQELPRL